MSHTRHFGAYLAGQGGPQDSLRERPSPAKIRDLEDEADARQISFERYGNYVRQVGGSPVPTYALPSLDRPHGPRIPLRERLALLYPKQYRLDEDGSLRRMSTRRTDSVQKSAP